MNGKLLVGLIIALVIAGSALIVFSTASSGESTVKTDNYNPNSQQVLKDTPTNEKSVEEKAQSGNKVAKSKESTSNSQLKSSNSKISSGPNGSNSPSKGSINAPICNTGCNDEY